MTESIVEISQALSDNLKLNYDVLNITFVDSIIRDQIDVIIELAPEYLPSDYLKDLSDHFNELKVDINGERYRFSICGNKVRYHRSDDELTSEIRLCIKYNVIVKETYFEYLPTDVFGVVMSCIDDSETITSLCSIHMDMCRNVSWINVMMKRYPQYVDSIKRILNDMPVHERRNWKNIFLNIVTYDKILSVMFDPDSDIPPQLPESNFVYTILLPIKIMRMYPFLWDTCTKHERLPEIFRSNMYFPHPEEHNDFLNFLKTGEITTPLKHDPDKNYLAQQLFEICPELLWKFIHTKGFILTDRYTLYKILSALSRYNLKHFQTYVKELYSRSEPLLVELINDMPVRMWIPTESYMKIRAMILSAIEN